MACSACNAGACSHHGFQGVAVEIATWAALTIERTWRSQTPVPRPSQAPAAAAAGHAYHCCEVGPAFEECRLRRGLMAHKMPFVALVKLDKAPVVQSPVYFCPPLAATKRRRVLESGVEVLARRRPLLVRPHPHAGRGHARIHRPRDRGRVGAHAALSEAKTCSVVSTRHLPLSEVMLTEMGVPQMALRQVTIVV